MDRTAESAFLFSIRVFIHLSLRHEGWIALLECLGLQKLAFRFRILRGFEVPALEWELEWRLWCRRQSSAEMRVLVMLSGLS